MHDGAPQIYSAQLPVEWAASILCYFIAIDTGLALHASPEFKFAIRGSLPTVLIINDVYWNNLM
jgi:hypothetical protein